MLTARLCPTTKQAWRVECSTDESTNESLRLKLFFLDLHSVPRNHVRYISWIAYVVRRDPETGARKDCAPVQNAPHCNLYMQDGVDLGALMDTNISLKAVSTQFAVRRLARTTNLRLCCEVALSVVSQFAAESRPRLARMLKKRRETAELAARSKRLIDCRSQKAAVCKSTHILTLQGSIFKANEFWCQRNWLSNSQIFRQSFARISNDATLPQNKRLEFSC